MGELYTIEDLRNGKCSVCNDGTLVELRKVLAKAFGEEGGVPTGVRNFYSRDSALNAWVAGSGGLPAQSVQLFNVDDK